MYEVSDIQACEVETLQAATVGTPISVIVTTERDDTSAGCARVTVTGRTMDQVIDFVREHWGMDDSEWFQSYIVERVQYIAPFTVGTRLALSHDVDRYPHFIATKGMTGVVTNADHDLFSMKMDEHIDAEEWENEIHWYPTNGDDPARDLELAEDQMGEPAIVIGGVVIDAEGNVNEPRTPVACANDLLENLPDSMPTDCKDAEGIRYCVNVLLDHVGAFARLATLAELVPDQPTTERPGAVCPACGAATHRLTSDVTGDQVDLCLQHGAINFDPTGEHFLAGVEKAWYEITKGELMLVDESGDNVDLSDPTTKLASEMGKYAVWFSQTTAAEQFDANDESIPGGTLLLAEVARRVAACIHLLSYGGRAS